LNGALDIARAGDVLCLLGDVDDDLDILVLADLACPADNVFFSGLVQIAFAKRERIEAVE
jgi:hypothetical protein